jgi:hypothetical protein
MMNVYLEGPDRAIRPVLLALPCGADELAFGPGSGAAGVTGLLARLVHDGAGEPLDLATLSISQTDRLLAALYTALYGPRAECQLRCGACPEPYEFTLDLDEIIAAQDSERPGPCDEEGCWTLPDGRRLRAPALADMGDDPATLMTRLIVAGDPALSPAMVDDWLERAAPLLSLDLDAACPHCQHHAVVRFDLAVFLAARLAGERPFLLREVHLIAARYGWDRTEIMALSRDERRTYAGLIEGERSAGLRLARRSA